LLVLTDPLGLNVGVAATGTGKRGTPKQKLKQRLGVYLTRSTPSGRHCAVFARSNPYTGASTRLGF
jgi:hypothetical protein